ncbi:hypothetical protein [Lysobacter gummosus]|uniref:hypothetical protein n=1 Tax=Lysobacter gummosus TaxID=262324 RepID=UPI0036278AD4
MRLYRLGSLATTPEYAHQRTPRHHADSLRRRHHRHATRHCYDRRKPWRRRWRISVSARTIPAISAQASVRRISTGSRDNTGAHGAR